MLPKGIIVLVLILVIVTAAIFSGSARFVGQTSEWGRDTGVDGVIANYPLLDNSPRSACVQALQEELSCIIGATRSRVTEILNELQSENKILLSHRQIHLI